MILNRVLSAKYRVWSLKSMAILCTFVLTISCSAHVESKKSKEVMIDSSLSKATFGAGCFWCVEAIFQEIKGVDTVVSGYSGGAVLDPTYKEVCSGTTGHAEVIQVYFDESIVSFETLLEVFWKTHDPTTLNRQGADVGTQYRSVIFYHSIEQKETAELYKKKLNEAGIWDDPIVTEISAFEKFYAAEEYHQNYYRENGATNGYCRVVITPKVEKFKKVFEHLKK